MSDLSPDEREFLANVRDAWQPNASMKTAVRTGIEGRLGADPEFGADAPGPASVAPARAASALGRARDAFRGPWGIGTGVVVVGLCAAGLYALRAPEPTPGQATPTVQAPLPLPKTDMNAPAAPVAAPTEAVSVDSLPNVAPSPRPSPLPSVAQPASAEAPAAADTLAAELALLRAAQASLRAGAPADALATLSTHGSRFPRGALREERMTLQVLALCDRGDVAAARAIRDELARSAPGSSHLQRLSSSCVTP